DRCRARVDPGFAAYPLRARLASGAGSTIAAVRGGEPSERARAQTSRVARAAEESARETLRARSADPFSGGAPAGHPRRGIRIHPPGSACAALLSEDVRRSEAEGRQWVEYAGGPSAVTAPRSGV